MSIEPNKKLYNYLIVFSIYQQKSKLLKENILLKLAKNILVSSRVIFPMNPKFGWSSQENLERISSINS